MNSTENKADVVVATELEDGNQVDVDNVQFDEKGGENLGILEKAEGEIDGELLDDRSKDEKEQDDSDLYSIQNFRFSL